MALVPPHPQPVTVVSSDHVLLRYGFRLGQVPFKVNWPAYPKLDLKCCNEYPCCEWANTILLAVTGALLCTQLKVE